jgi:hypothetical protein
MSCGGKPTPGDTEPEMCAGQRNVRAHAWTQDARGSRARRMQARMKRSAKVAEVGKLSLVVKILFATFN